MVYFAEIESADEAADLGVVEPGVAGLGVRGLGAALGGKARSLGRLAAAGLRTPPAFVVTDQLFRSLLAAPLGSPAAPWDPDVDSVLVGKATPPPARLADVLRALLPRLDAATATLQRTPFPSGFIEALSLRLAAVGGVRFSVRSSCGIEDDPSATAAGVFSSVLNVTAAEVPAALRAVLASMVSPGAAAYCLAQGRRIGGPPVAVLVHPFIPGTAAGTMALDPSRQTEPLVHVRVGQIGPDTRASLVATLGKLVTLYGACEMEWVNDDGQVTFLQLRPYRAPTPIAPWPGLAELAALAGDPSAWRWDAAHNPWPLSPAQAGLVALVDGRCKTGLRQRSVGGYLFYAHGGPPPARVLAPSEARAAFDELSAAVAVDLARLSAAPSDLEDALELFVSSYDSLFGMIQPAIRRGRALLSDFLRMNLPDSVGLVPVLLSEVPSLASERRTLAERLVTAATPTEQAAAIDAYLARFGDEAPVWDVSVPTFAESPKTLRGRSGGPRAASPVESEPSWKALSGRILQRLPRMARRLWKQVLPLARDAVALGEADDHLFARLQAAVRRALLRQGERLCAAGHLDHATDVFFLPLEVVRRLASADGGSSLPPPDLRSLAAQARVLWDEQRRSPPELPSDLPSDLPTEPSTLVVRGAGTQGRAIGRVVRSLGSGDPAGTGSWAGTVLVAATVLPTELPLLDPVAFVTETGGPLDHVAAQARERGLPAVVGAAGALAALRDGDLVLVDGDAGVVVRLGVSPGPLDLLGQPGPRAS